MNRLEQDHKKKNRVSMTVAQTAFAMAILTLGSKLIGFIREMVMAGCFGTSYVVDAYVMAQSIPNIVFAGIFGAVATSYMPLLSEKIEKGSEKDGNTFTSQVLNFLFVASIVSAIIGLIFSDQLTSLFAKGFKGEVAELTSSFLKVTFAYVIFTSTTGIINAYLQYKNTFIPQIFFGYVQNIIVIGTIIASAHFNYNFLALGLLIGYAVVLLLTYTIARRRGLKYSSHSKDNKTIIKQIVALAIPVFIGSSVSQINLFVDKYLASSLVVGSVAALNYANILNGMIMALSITILSSLIYPRLAQASASEETERFNSLVQKGFNLIILIAVPFSLGAMLYSDEIVQVIFERGAFDVEATSLTGSAYFFYSAGMVFMSLNTLFTNIYYSMHNMKMPMFFATISVIINILLNLLLVGTMQHNGLALATSISSFCNTVLLYVGLRKKYKQIRIAQSTRKVILFTICSLISVALSYVIYRVLTTIVWMPRLLYLGIAVLSAMSTYLGLLKKFGVEEINIIQELKK